MHQSPAAGRIGPGETTDCCLFARSLLQPCEGSDPGCTARQDAGLGASPPARLTRCSCQQLSAAGPGSVPVASAAVNQPRLSHALPVPGACNTSCNTGAPSSFTTFPSGSVPGARDESAPLLLGTVGKLRHASSTTSLMPHVTFAVLLPDSTSCLCLGLVRGWAGS